MGGRGRTKHFLQPIGIASRIPRVAEGLPLAHLPVVGCHSHNGKQLWGQAGIVVQACSTRQCWFASLNLTQNPLNRRGPHGDGVSNSALTATTAVHTSQRPDRHNSRVHLPGPRYAADTAMTMSHAVGTSCGCLPRHAWCILRQECLGTPKAPIAIPWLGSIGAEEVCVPCC